jgi:ion channel-forming bestrophin family protein
VIIRPRPTLFQLFFIVRGSIVPRIAPQIIGFAIYAVAVVAITRALNIDVGGYGLAPFTLLGVTLSIYLGFRNNAAYDRWWEGRKLWGQLVFDIRNLARSATALIPSDTGETRPLLKSAVAFCHFLRGQLRDIDVSKEAATFLGGEFEAINAYANKGDAVLRRMGLRVGDLKRSGRIDAMDYRILDERLSTLAALQAGCERIANTPLPFAYTLLLLRSAYVFCLLLPFGMASSLGWLTPLLTAVVAYSFFGLDALSAELEDPFGTEANDLPLDRMCRICEISVAEALGETPPPAMKAVDFYSS